MKSDFSKVILRSKKNAAKKPRKEKRPPYKVPAWFRSLKPGSHGSTPSQKKAWKVVSDYVRERDFKKYHQCVSCDRVFMSWQEGQAGHYRPWGSCNSWMKFCVDNIALQCASCNGPMSGADTGYRFGEEMKRRYGAKHLEWIEKENEKYRGKKIEEWELVEFIARLRPDLVME